MRNVLLTVVLAATAASCASPVVYAPGDLDGQPATGRIEPLATVLKDAGGSSVRLVFVHGVGDHCAGYALDPRTGWLNDATAARIGLAAKGGAPAAYRTVSAETFIDGSTNAASTFELGRRSFAFSLGAAPAIDIDAVEITWSHTTQWLKSDVLGYDSPSVTPTSATGAEGCVVPQSRAVPMIKRPPSRLWLDRVIKEQVFDRNLADAIIYTGTYGEVIERAFADALCRSMVETPDDVRCDWGRIDLAEDGKRRYLFVTHSLGSRIVYDALLHLVGAESPGRANPFSVEEWSRSRPAVRQVIANTPAFFMMANQLALLGLANVSPRSDPKDGPRPTIVVAQAAQPSIARLTRADSIQWTDDLLAAEGCDNPLAKVAQVRSQALQSLRSSSGDEPALKIVAFNDTNDLLTWHVPSWYATGKGTCRPKVALSNVFVRNTLPLLVVESPTAAHGGYFGNPAVWQAIVCGAVDGRLLDCAR